MKTYPINNKITLVGHRENTRSGFRHRVELLINGQKVDQTTVGYQNRTWEKYEFQTAFKKLVSKTSYLTAKEKVMANRKLENDVSGSGSDMSGLKTIGAVAMMGDIFGKSDQEKADWKKRMLKAGLSGRGLMMPHDFDTLPATEQNKRLDMAIGELTGVKSKVKKKLKKKGKKSKKVGSADWVKQQTGGLF